MDPSYRPSRRRSVPRLPDFSITPLRTQLQESLADIQGGHSYSQPQTPRSPRSAFHSPSHTPAVLSRASSRDPSRSGGRRRKLKSALLLADLERPFIGNNGEQMDTEMLPSKSKSSLRLHKVQTDVAAHPMKGHIPRSKSMGGAAIAGARSTSGHTIGTEWLLSTASVLAMASAESKGQSWLATKSASTSLAGTPYIEREEFSFRPINKTHDGHDLIDSPPVSKPGTRRNSISSGRPRSRGGSRPASRTSSRIGSRINMSARHERRSMGDIEQRTDYFSNMGVDFADQALDEEDESGSELDEEEEGELKKLVWGRVGGWVDWAVGWMDWRDGLHGIDDEDVPDSEQNKTISPRPRNRRRTMRKDIQRDITLPNTSALNSSPPIAAAPESAGLVGDAKWLLGVVGKLIV